MSSEGGSLVSLQKEIFSLDPKNSEALRSVAEAVQDRIDKSRAALSSKDRDKAKAYLAQAMELMGILPPELSAKNRKQINAQKVQINILLKEASRKPAPVTHSAARKQSSPSATQPSTSAVGILKETMPSGSAAGASGSAGKSRQQPQPTGITQKPTILKEDM
jgi:hypothetical protein